MTSSDAPPPYFPGSAEEWGDLHRGRHMEWWDFFFARQVLGEAQRRRKELKLSAKDLSRRLAEAGWPLSVNSVNGMLGAKGRQSITVPQVIALSQALETRPMDLMFSTKSWSEVMYRLGELLDEHDAKARFAGQDAESDPYLFIEKDLLALAERVRSLRPGRNEAQDGAS